MVPESIESTFFKRTKKKSLIDFVLRVFFFPSLVFSTCHSCRKAWTGYLPVAVTVCRPQALFSLGSEKCVAFLQHFTCASIFNGDCKEGIMWKSRLVLFECWLMACNALHTICINAAEWEILGEGMPQLSPYFSAGQRRAASLDVFRCWSHLARYQEEIF